VIVFQEAKSSFLISLFLSLSLSLFFAKVPDDKDQLQQLIQRHIRLIRVDCADERTKRQLIVRLCELRIKLNEISEEEEAKFIVGHLLTETFAAPSTQRPCDVCQKKAKASLIAPLLLSTSANNALLTCLFCSYTVHQQCSLHQVSMADPSDSSTTRPNGSAIFDKEKAPSMSSDGVRTGSTSSRM
jgi:hypothetical protein